MVSAECTVETFRVSGRKGVNQNRELTDAPTWRRGRLWRTSYDWRGVSPTIYCSNRHALPAVASPQGGLDGGSAQYKIGPINSRPKRGRFEVRLKRLFQGINPLDGKCGLRLRARRLSSR